MEINEWNKYSKEVDEQSTKQKIYDNILVKFCQNEVKDKSIIDFGCGTGEIAQRIQKISNEIKVYDESKAMRKSASEKVGKDNVYQTLEEIPFGKFDVLLSSLVICIVKEKGLEKIMNIMTKSIKDKGIAYIGFCNPKDYNIPETSLQYRKKTKFSYKEKHEYKKIIKEGNFQITEQHRPLDFYENLFEKFGFKIEEIKYSTPEIINGKKHSDFVIYKLLKK